MKKKSNKIQIIETIVRKVLKEGISEFPNEESEFLDELESLDSVKKLSEKYGVNTDKVVNQLKSRIVVLRYNDKRLKEMSIDFTDTSSGINVKLRKRY